MKREDPSSDLDYPRKRSEERGFHTLGKSRVEHPDPCLCCHRGRETAFSVEEAGRVTTTFSKLVPQGRGEYPGKQQYVPSLPFSSRTHTPREQ